MEKKINHYKVEHKSGYIFWLRTREEKKDSSSTTFHKVSKEEYLKGIGLIEQNQNKGNEQ